MPGTNKIQFEKGATFADLEKGTEFNVDHDGESSDSEDESFYSERFGDYHKTIKDLGVKPKDLLLPFKELEQYMEPVTEDGGVKKQVLKMGTGIVIPEKSVVIMNYDAFFENAELPFDSTRLRNKPFKFLLGKGAVILGLDCAIKTMKKDEIAKVLVSPEYAYGKMGCKPRIPENAHILYIVEILSFIDSKEAIEFEELDTEDQKRASFEKISAVFHCEHKMANELFENKHYKPAIARYRKMVRLLEVVSVANEKEDETRQKYLLKLYLNLSLAYLKILNSDKSRTYAGLALKIQPNNVKGLYRMGCAFMMRDEFEGAENYLIRAKKQSPNDKSINKTLLDLAKKREHHLHWEQAFCKRALASENKENKAVKNPDHEELKSVLKKEFEAFQESDKKELKLSPGYTAEQIEVIEELAREINLVFVNKIQDDTKLLKVVKH